MKLIDKRSFVRMAGAACTLAATATLALLPGTAFAQVAAGTVTIVVPYPAGGVSDLLARAVAPAMGKLLSRTVVIENVTGASGSIAAAKVLAAPANGTMLFMGSPTEVVLAPMTIKAVKYTAADFRLLDLVNTSSLALYVRGDLPVNSVDELLAYARKPGAKELSYGSTGPGSLYHLAGDSLREAAGLNAVHIPYRGGMPLLQDLMGGSVDMTVMPADGTIAKMVDSGKMRAIAVAAPARSPRFPNVPTFAESKGLPKFGTPQAWVGLLVPAATPEPVAAQLHKALADAMAQPEVRHAVEAAGGTVPAPMSLAQANSFLRQDSAKLEALAKAAKLEPN